MSTRPGVRRCNGRWLILIALIVALVAPTFGAVQRSPRMSASLRTTGSNGSDSDLWSVERLAQSGSPFNEAEDTMDATISARQQPSNKGKLVGRNAPR